MIIFTAMKSRIIILFILQHFICLGQNGELFGVQARLKSGFLIGHRPVMGHLPKEHAFAGELSFLRKSNGSKAWHSSYKMPEYGITLFTGSVGNMDILGTYFGAYGFLDIPWIKKEKFHLNGKLGAGMGFGTKQYDEVKNPKNVAMSSIGNALICMGVDARYYFKKNWVSLGVDMTHFSNGSFKVPNLGLNLPFVSIGFGRYVRNTKSDLDTTATFITPQRKILYGITGIISAKEVFPTNGKKYPVFAVSAHARVFLKPKVGWELSLDLIDKQAIFGYRPEIEKNQLDIIQFGVYGGYLLPLDRFHFVLGMGYYLRDKYQPEDPFYHRVGIRYYLKNGIQLNCVLKSHWARADYVEWGIGYTINYQSK